MAEKIKLTKRRVAEIFVALVLKPRTDVKVLGVGSGTTIEEAFRPEFGLADWIRKHNVKCVATSFQAHKLLQDSVPNELISDLNNSKTLVTNLPPTQIDVAFDGADEVVLKDNVLIKGGGACNRLEKAVAVAARELHILVDWNKISDNLGSKWKKGIPIEIEVDRKAVSQCDFRSTSTKFESVKNRMRDTFDADVADGDLIVRKCDGGKLGPIVTDTGNLIVDWLFKTEKARSADEWKEIDKKIDVMDGVVGHGLFSNLATTCFIGKEDGSVDVVVVPTTKKFSFDSNACKKNDDGAASGGDEGGDAGAELRKSIREVQRR